MSSFLLGFLLLIQDGVAAGRHDTTYRVDLVYLAKPFLKQPQRPPVRLMIKRSHLIRTRDDDRVLKFSTEVRFCLQGTSVLAEKQMEGRHRWFL